LALEVPILPRSQRWEVLSQLAFSKKQLQRGGTLQRRRIVVFVEFQPVQGVSSPFLLQSVTSQLKSKSALGGAERFIQLLRLVYFYGREGLRRRFLRPVGFNRATA
jgi:hypothetical protein